MNRRTASLAITVTLAVSACTGSDVEEPIPAADPGTTTSISPSPTEPVTSDAAVQSTTNR